jgi:hypothetical protein
MIFFVITRIVAKPPCPGKVPVIKWLAAMWERACQLIVDPEKTWLEIKQERITPVQLLRSFAAPLALLPVISGIGRSLWLRGHYFGWSLIFDLFTTGVVNYVLMLAALLFSGWVVSLMAPYFGSKADLTAAHKVVIYSMTPVWLASVFQLVPRLGALSLLGLYGAFLLYTSLPVLLETPPDKQNGLAAAIIVFGLAVMMFLSLGAVGTIYL